MRDLLKMLATAAVMVVAAGCVLVQVNHVNDAVDRLQHHDGASIVQVDQDTTASR